MWSIYNLFAENTTTALAVIILGDISVVGGTTTALAVVMAVVGFERVRLNGLTTEIISVDPIEFCVFCVFPITFRQNYGI